MKPNWNETEKAIYREWERGQFDKVGMSRVCESIAEKLGSTPVC